MKEETYNGWTNWETWNAHLWLDSLEWSQRAMSNCYSIQELQTLWADFVECMKNIDDIDEEKINFQEILDHYGEEGEES